MMDDVAVLVVSLKKFRSILALSADEPNLLRACDVERVLDAAHDEDCLHEFRTWLLSHDLQDRTRSRVKIYEG